MRTRRGLIFIYILLAWFTAPDIANAQNADNPQVETRVTNEYASEIKFQATIVSDKPVRTATLNYSTDHSDAFSLQALVTAEDETFTVALLDLRTAPLLPFTILEYAWHIEFEDGTSFETVAHTFEYFDNRLPWKTLTQSPIVLRWVDGGTDFAQAVLLITQESISSLRRDLAIPGPTDLRMYIYPQRSWLQSAMDLTNTTLSGDHSDRLPGVILLAASEGKETDHLIERDLPHEVAHFMLFELLQGDEQNLPRWLVEGIATAQEFMDHPDYQLALESANQNERLIRLEQLCETFPRTEDESRLAFGMSASFTRYLIGRYGPEKLNQLIRAYANDVGCSSGVEQVFGQPLDQLENEWKLVTFVLPPDRTLHEFIPRMFLVTPLILLVLAVAIHRGGENGVTHQKGVED